MLDSFYAGDIIREEMLALSGRYDEQLRNINARISAPESLCAIDKESLKTAIFPLLRGEKYSEVYYKRLLHSITVHEDNTFQLRLKNLSRVFIFAAD